MSDRPDNRADKPELSIVVPMYNEQEMVPILIQRLTEVLDGQGTRFEILCVNDGSRDGTAQALAAANARDARVRAINLSRNFGKETALTAGLDHAVGSAVIPMDADLQDPPELIAELLAKWREGFDVVCAIRRRRTSDSWVKRHTANAFYSVMSRLSGVDMPPEAGDFRLMDRRVVDALLGLRERNRFMKGLFAWVGFRRTEVYYDRPERVAGKTKFNYWKLWNLALDGITGFSTLPLRMAGYLGALVAVASLVYGSYLVVRTLTSGVDVPGYASLMVAVLFMSGVQLIVLGTIGEYLGRVYGETKQRPLYLIDTMVGVERPARPTEPAHPVPARLPVSGGARGRMRRG